METGFKLEPMDAARRITQTTHHGPSVIDSLFKEACITAGRWTVRLHVVDFKRLHSRRRLRAECLVTVIHSSTVVIMRSMLSILRQCWYRLRYCRCL